MQDETSEWHQGRVERHHATKAYGWMECPEVGTVWVHLSSFEKRPSKILKGMVIRFRFVNDPGKPNPRAVDAEMIS